MSRRRGDPGEVRALETVGLARRAGRLVLGTRAVLEASATGKLRAVVLARDASPGARDRLGAALRSGGVPVLAVSSRERLAAALGREDLVVAGVTDVGFAGRLAELLPAGGGAEARRSGVRRASRKGRERERHGGSESERCAPVGERARQG